MTKRRRLIVDLRGILAGWLLDLALFVVAKEDRLEMAAAVYLFANSMARKYQQASDARPADDPQ
jgi:hypothetical protein